MDQAQDGARFNVWVKRSAEIEDTYAIRFEVRGGEAVLRVWTPIMLMDVPPRRHGFEEDLSAGQLRQCRVMIIDHEGQRAREFLLTRLAEADLKAMDPGYWQELQATTRGEEHHLDVDRPCDIIQLGSIDQIPLTAQIEPERVGFSLPEALTLSEADDQGFRLDETPGFPGTTGFSSIEGSFPEIEGDQPEIVDGPVQVIGTLARPGRTPDGDSTHIHLQTRRGDQPGSNAVDVMPMAALDLAFGPLDTDEEERTDPAIHQAPPEVDLEDPKDPLLKGTWAGCAPPTGLIRHLRRTVMRERIRVAELEARVAVAERQKAAIPEPKPRVRIRLGTGAA